MNFNLITNIEQCLILVENTVPVKMVYYSHIPSAVVAIIIGLFIFIRGRKSLQSKLLLSLSITFSLWCAFDIILWTSYDSRMYMFFWSFMILLEALFFVLAVYLIYVFADGRDISMRVKVILTLLLMPIIVLISSDLNLTGFTITDCVPIEGPLRNFYALPLYAVLFIWVVSLSLYKYKKIEGGMKRQFLLFASGIILFLLAFILAEYLVSYLIDNEIFPETSGYVFEMYGLLGMPVFLALLAFIIVRFRTFDIKLIGAQALIVSLIVLIGSQFFFIQNFTNQILTGITLVITGVIGINLIRSVKKEVMQREQIEVQEKELEIANSKQEGLIHFISHEIKGYLGKSEAAFAGIVEGDYGVIPKEVNELATSALADTRKGVATVMDILNASNLKKGTVAYTMRPFDLKNVVTTTITELGKAAEAKNLSLKTDIGSGEFTITGDESQIKEHVVRNLIDNAIKYTPSGSVTMSLKKQAGKIMFSVKDSGIGITDEDKAKLFTEGGRGKESIRTNVNSTGYGLFIAKQIVDAHKGRIWAESEGAGKGSTFFVELPA